MARLDRQQGFGIVEVAVVTLVLVIAGLLTVMYAQQNNNEKLAASELQKAIADDTVAEPSSDAAPDRSLATVEQFYETYAKRSEDAANGRAEPVNAMNLQREFPDHVSEAASKQVSEIKTSVDPVLCSQNIPTSFTFSKPELKDGQVSVTVSGKFEGGESQTLVRVDQESNKITMFTCGNL